jgi:hypothetical protein
MTAASFRSTLAGDVHERMLEEETMPKKSHGPSVKDSARYERLRKQGMSKEKAARIANAARQPRRNPSRRGGRSPAYESWSRQDLYRKAKEVGIAGRSSMNKQQLIHALRHH